METTLEKRTSWLDRPVVSAITLNWETILFATILILAVVSRFYDLGARVMSHDETSHVYFSWLYEQGNGYSHDPVTHGPLQFHLVAFSYFLFGDSDFSARIPVAIFSIATVFFMWYFRRFLGRAGAIVAALLMLISPYILYYGRYVRNEAFVGLFGVITLWAILRYLESGENRYLYWLTIATVFHFTAKETSFIYTAQALIFLAIYLVYRLIQNPWPEPGWRKYFIFAIIVALLLITITGGTLWVTRSSTTLDASETASPAVPGEDLAASTPTGLAALPSIFIISTLLALLVVAYTALRGYSWSLLRNERSFGMLILLGSLVLPMLSPFPVELLGHNPIDYQNTQTIIWDAIFIAIFTLIAVVIGLLWNPRLWLVNAALFYAIFTVFYTSIFTNGFGFVTGLVGSLGYWLEQQGVNRGSQPWYYYGLIQLPIYEFLPALGTLGALFYALWRGQLSATEPESSPQTSTVDTQDTPLDDQDTLGTDQTATSLPVPVSESPPTLSLLLFWSFTSLLAYTIAGEKMPWLTVHITLPMILTAGWYLGFLIDKTDWRLFLRQRGILVVLVLPIFFISLLATIGQVLGTDPPFQGTQLNQLQATSTFITALLTTLGSGWALTLWVKPWASSQLQRVVILTGFALLGLLTARAAIRAAYINYDNAKEYLVYAHMARGPKEALEQLEEISQRTTNGLALRVAYDNETTYPYWWYLRNFTNKDYFGTTPTRAQRDAVAILVGDANYGKIEPVVGQAYHLFEYTRIWWPNQDYFGLTWERVRDAFTDPKMRSALYKVWLNRDFTEYSQLTAQDMSLPNWQPSNKFRLYVRKDVVASLWNYGAAPAEEIVLADPYEGKEIKLSADRAVGTLGTEPGQFKRPRGIAVGPNDSLYVADTENHRIQHFAPDGTFIKAWGNFAASTEGAPAAEGLFNEPWGIAVGPDGAVYVADTWNHRIQKFSAEGEFIKTWGFGISQTDDPLGFYGPRGIAVDNQGHVFVTDTGNKRVVVFDTDGNYVTKFGSTGLSLGQFDEPVGIAVNSAGLVYVADTWNQRIQTFIAEVNGSYLPVNSWEISAWYGQSLDNKPYIAVDNQGQIFVADPEGYRVLQFSSEGEFIQYWGDFSIELDGFDLPSAVAADAESGIWVSDTNNNRILHFTLPPK